MHTNIDFRRGATPMTELRAPSPTGVDKRLRMRKAFIRVKAGDFARILREVPASSDRYLFEKNIRQAHRQSLGAAFNAHEMRACPHDRFITSILCSYCGLSAASRCLRIFRFVPGAPADNDASPAIMDVHIRLGKRHLQGY